MSVFKRNGKWCAKVYDPTRPSKQRWLGSNFANRRLARTAEREWYSKRRPSGPETVESFVETWLARFPRESTETHKRYQYVADRFATDFAGVRLDEITRLMARDWAAQHPVSATEVIRTMFNNAKDVDLILVNPFSALMMKRSRGRRDLEVISEAELYGLADAALRVHPGLWGEVFRAAIIVAGYTAVRPGELFALRHDHIDLDGLEIYVEDAVKADGSIGAPKNGQARTIILPPQARAALERMPKLDAEFVFMSQRGVQFRKGNHYHAWNPVRAAVGRPRMAFYELRHFCATMLLEMGVSHADVAIQLGHRDGGKLVMEVYGHPSADKARDRIRKAWQAHWRRWRPAT
jgi:integrase